MKQKGGNKYLNIIIYILAVIGAVAVIFTIINVGMNFSATLATDSTTIDSNPPNAYMNEGGLNCPDYWINVSNANNKNSCRNAYKIPNKAGQVTTDETFSAISDEVWNSSEERGTLSGVKSRCNWLNSNGGAWQGISQYC
jgi:hypothetical protein